MTSCLTSSSQGTHIELAHTGPAPSHDASSLLRHRSSYPTASFTSLFSVAMLASLVLLAPLLISLTSPVYAEESTADEHTTEENTGASSDVSTDGESGKSESVATEAEVEKVDPAATKVITAIIDAIIAVNESNSSAGAEHASDEQQDEQQTDEVNDAEVAEEVKVYQPLAEVTKEATADVNVGDDEDTQSSVADVGDDSDASVTEKSSETGSDESKDKNSDSSSESTNTTDDHDGDGDPTETKEDAKEEENVEKSQEEITEETAPNRDGTESVLDFLPNSLAPVGTVFRMPLHSGALTEEARSELLSQLTILINVALEPYTLANTHAEGAESQANLLLPEEFEFRPITRDGETFIIILPTMTKDSDSYEDAIYNLWSEVKGKFFDATQGQLAEDYNEEMAREELGLVSEDSAEAATGADNSEQAKDDEATEVDQSALASPSSDVEDDLVGLLGGGAEIMRALKKDHKPGQHILNTVMTHSSRYDFERVSVYSFLSDAQREANERRYDGRDILTLKQATEQLHYMEGKLRELGVDPHSDPDGGWQKPASQNEWTVGVRASVLSDSFLDFGRNYVFETSGEKLSREQFNDAVTRLRSEEYSSLLDVEELIEAYFHLGNTPESIIDQNSLQEFNYYLTLNYRAESDFYPSLYEEKRYRKSLNDFVIHDPVDFFENTKSFAENHGRPDPIRYALRRLRRLRESLDTASDSDLSRSREAAQVSTALKRLSEDKGVAFERLALISEPRMGVPIFILVELLD